LPIQRCPSVGCLGEEVAGRRHVADCPENNIAINKDGTTGKSKKEEENFFFFFRKSK